MFGDARQGLSTADNNRFLRMWYEVDNNNIFYEATDYIQAMYTGKKWFPHDKGGEFRRWFGNNDYIINYENNGKELQQFDKAVLRNQNYYFREGFSWSSICSGMPSFRYKTKGFIFNAAGSTCFSEQYLKYLLGYCNSKVLYLFTNIISPTLNITCGDISSMPVIAERNNEVNNIVEKNINLSKEDWDAFETSWDFKKHPLI